MRNNLVYITLILMFIPIFGSCSKIRLSYTGSSTIGMGIMPEASAAFTKVSRIKFGTIKNPGSGKGIMAVIDGKAPLGGASRALNEKEIDKGLYVAVIGYDAIAVAVNKNNTVSNLSKKELKGIFTGKIKNWKDVGGKDATIIPIVEILGQKRATLEMFQKIVMDKEPFAKDVKQIDLPRDHIPAIVKDENAICHVSLSFMDDTVKVLSVNGVRPDAGLVRDNSYLISRPLIMFTKGFPTGIVKHFIKFMLSHEGQEIVAKKFVTVMNGDSN